MYRSLTLCRGNACVVVNCVWVYWFTVHGFLCCMLASLRLGWGSDWSLKNMQQIHINWMGCGLKIAWNIYLLIHVTYQWLYRTWTVKALNIFLLKSLQASSLQWDATVGKLKMVEINIYLTFYAICPLSGKNCLSIECFYSEEPASFSSTMGCNSWEFTPAALDNSAGMTTSK